MSDPKFKIGDFVRSDIFSGYGVLRVSKIVSEHEGGWCYYFDRSHIALSERYLKPVEGSIVINASISLPAHLAVELQSKAEAKGVSQEFLILKAVEQYLTGN